VLFFCNLVAKPSQRAGVPYPVICRSVFGVRGANIPAIIRGLIAVAWYGIQTYLASASLDILLVRLWPGLEPYSDVTQHGMLGLSTLGYFTFAVFWMAQAAVFWRGMDTIRRFIDFAGPAVYVVMFLLCGYLLYKGRLAREPQPVGSCPRWHRDDHHDVRGHRAGRLVLLRPDAELR
jgi:Cytosine/uracil/thiamine/allantoin permeases